MCVSRYPFIQSTGFSFLAEVFYRKLCIENILTQGDHSTKKTVPPHRGKENMAQKQNYAVKMDLLKQKKIAAGLVSDCFPEVSGMVIVMTYFRKGLNPFLMLRTVNVFPFCLCIF